MAPIPYPNEHLEFMVLFFQNLNEKHQRYYAALEANKIGHGGIIYISTVLGISEKRIRRGLAELEKKSF